MRAPSERGEGRARRVALASILVVLAPACAETPSGECTDKGLCDPSEPDASLGLGARPGVAPDAGRDASADAWLDSALDAPSDASIDAPPEASFDASTDTPFDAAADAPAPTCSCVEAPPSGWAGPLALAESTGTPPPAIAPCSAPYGAQALEAASDPVAASAQCGCTCSAATGVTCPAPVVDLFSDSACLTRCNGAQSAGACFPLSTSGCGAAVFARAPAPTPDGGACAPKPSATIPPSAWTRVSRACALPAPAPQGDCAASQVCAPPPASPFSGHLCVALSGDVTCPSPSAYSVRHVSYAGADDTRSCSTCDCAPPTGGTCAGAVSFYNTNACTLPTKTFDLGAACNAVQIATSGVATSSLTESNSACTPSAPRATGAFVPTSPTTVCCLP